MRHNVQMNVTAERVLFTLVAIVFAEDVKQYYFLLTAS